MEYAYSKGIRARRDLKPENVMISQEGVARITDFRFGGCIGCTTRKFCKLDEEHWFIQQDTERKLYLAPPLTCRQSDSLMPQGVMREAIFMPLVSCFSKW